MGKAVRSPPQPGTAPGLACAQSFLPPAQRHACRGVPAAAPLCRRKLEEALNSGTTVVLDRYAYSGVAYTVAKGVPGLDLEWCKAPDKGLPAPDALIFLDVTEQQAAARGGYGSETYENVVFQRSVRSLPPRVMHAKVCTRTFARSGVVDGSRDVLRSCTSSAQCASRGGHFWMRGVTLTLCMRRVPCVTQRLMPSQSPRAACKRLCPSTCQTRHHSHAASRTSWLQLNKQSPGQLKGRHWAGCGRIGQHPNSSAAILVGSKEVITVVVCVYFCAPPLKAPYLLCPHDCELDLQTERQ